jgi:hypothetical protein
MKFEKLLARAKRIALKLAQREIERILAKKDVPTGVKVSATEEGVALEGRDLKARVVTDPAVRNITRGGSQ